MRLLILNKCVYRIVNIMSQIANIYEDKKICCCKLKENIIVAVSRLALTRLTDLLVTQITLFKYVAS